eukprot:SAG31_NODE_1445_length_8320_cov_3.454081_5_plen_67_part_00
MHTNVVHQQLILSACNPEIGIAVRDNQRDADYNGSAAFAGESDSTAEVGRAYQSECAEIAPKGVPL